MIAATSAPQEHAPKLADYRYSRVREVCVPNLRLDA